MCFLLGGEVLLGMDKFLVRLVDLIKFFVVWNEGMWDFGTLRMLLLTRNESNGLLECVK